MPGEVRLLALSALAFIALSGCATGTEKGLKAFNAGQHEKALALWLPRAKAGDKIAQHNMGVLWQDGSTTSTPQDLNRAAEWFALSAQQGFVPSMLKLARIQLRLGYRDQAKTWLDLAARWNNAEARTILAENGWQTPPPDLALAQQQIEQQNSLIAGAVILCAVTKSCGPRGTTSTLVDTYEPNILKGPNGDCVYRTPQGTRTMRPINGQCPTLQN